MVPGTSWGLITEESWAALTSGSRGFQRLLLLLLALGVAIPAIFVVIGLKRIMRPIEDLIGAAREVAGDVGGGGVAAGGGGCRHGRIARHGTGFRGTSTRNA